MKIVEQLHLGLDAGVTRHWRYTKEMFDIKPEYLMTIAVADALSYGYDNIHSRDVLIRLECPTKHIAYQLVAATVGLKQWFAIKKDVKINRKGRADILATANNESHIIELKGFDPGKAQIEKEVVRIQQFFALNTGINSLVAGHIVFPSLVNYKERLTKYGRSLISEPTLKYEIVCQNKPTGVDSEDGMPAYFTNSLSIVCVDA